MDFRGHLRLPEDAGTGIPVLLRLDDIFVVISSGADELGAWRADDVAIERIFSNQFSIELNGESMVFLAQDALGFAYDGISAIEDLQERLTKRRVFKRSKKKPKQVEAASEVEPAAEASPPPVSAGQTAQEVEAPAAKAAEEPEDEPTDEPVLAGEPKAIWAPPSTAQPPAEPQVATEPDIELVVPEPVARRVESEPPVSPSADVRVSYPQPSTPPPPAVESSLAPSATTPEADTGGLVPRADAPLEGPPPSSDLESTSEPAPAVEEPPAVDPVPEQSEEPQAAPVADEPEFEIEEVSAASTGGTWADDTMVGVEPDELEFEIEEYVVPSAGAADMFTAPAPHGAGEPPTRETPEQLTEPESDVPEADSTPDVEEPAADDAPVEGRHVADDTEGPATSEDPDVEAPAEAVASNGHSKTPKTDESTESNKRERRHSLFGRSRDKKAPPHEHEYGEPKTIGGLKRQVCEVCGHVTFSGEDVYQGW